MKTDPNESASLHTPLLPEEPSPDTKTASKNWQGLGTELRELGNYLVHQLKRPFQKRSIHSYTVTKVESASPQVNRKTRNLEEYRKQVAAEVFQQGNGYISKTESEHIASAYLVMFGLASYQSDSDTKRTDFALKPVGKLNSKKQRAKMKQMITGMTWPQMKAFYHNDTLVIPRKGGVLKGTGRLIAGQKIRFNNWRKHTKPADTVVDPRAVTSLKMTMSNPNAVYVVVYGDRTPEEAGHAALFIGGKGKTPRKPLYISHLGVNQSNLDGVKMALPGFKVQATSNTFEEDCDQFGMPDYIVELTGLDHDKMIEHLERSTKKGYDLITRNCSTRVGELLLAGAPEASRKAVKKPNGFWTPFNVTTMTQELWKREQINNPDFQ